MGYPSKEKSTIFVYEADGLRLAHLGDLKQKVDADIVDKIGDIDILILGEVTKESIAVVSEIEPFFVVSANWHLL